MPSEGLIWAIRDVAHKVFNDPLDKALEVFLSDRPLVPITKALPSSRTLTSLEAYPILFVESSMTSRGVGVSLAERVTGQSSTRRT